MTRPTLVLAAALGFVVPIISGAQASRPIIAVFAHPDDERVIGPLLSRLGREGRETHLVIATDGSKGVRDFATIPAGPSLAAERAKEAACAANRLGVRKLHMLGLPDGGIASFDELGKLRSGVAAIIDSLRPAAVITFGPEGGTGHPDHRLVGDVVTQVIQSSSRYASIDLLYASLPSERLATAPPANPTVNGMAQALLTVRIPFEEQDRVAGREEFACHRTQYSPPEMDSVNKYLAHAWNGTVWLRPWNGSMRDSTLFRAARPGPSRPSARPMARANDYDRSAGVVQNGVLTVRLVAQRAQWHPGDESRKALPVDAFGEEGAPPGVPGPLIRAKVGTRVDAHIRNALPETLVVRGFGKRGPGSTPAPIRVAPGDSQRVAFTIDAAGAYVYDAQLRDGGEPIEGGHGTQLVGVIIGDSAATPRPERVMVVSFWNRLIDSTAKESPERFIFMFNGRLWPHTPRLTYTLGDTVRWRIVDGSFGEHPMHLHGFYFRVDSRGTGELDSTYTPDQRRTVVTENLMPFGNFTLTWVPTRTGNWLFHCHKPAHTAYQLRYFAADVDPPSGAQQVRHDVPHAMDGMSGLVVGVTVLPRRGDVAAAPPEPRQRVRVYAQERKGFYGTREGLGFITVRDTEPARDSILIPGSPIVVTRGVPAQVTVVNRTSNHTAVHWHGIELESFFDGVAGWSGAGTRTAPLIAPNDSFVARFTPPRAGTFIYHTHTDDVRQLERGLYAPLIVLEPGQRWDPTTDHVLMIGGAFEKDQYVVALNGSTTPRPLELEAGVRHRFRVINMTVDEDADLSLFASPEPPDSTLVTWRAIAKDGATLPDRMATARPARLHIAPGETYDFELTPASGAMRIEVKSVTTSVMPVAVRER
jgi:FtsP/CotA-like multicopper oxidase with cupredoxin domain/LmbE family N-acetylglucosaminyl deacetylase